ncbi:hypothetical protein QN277_017098 [Acacia crassicarpa]|uniref:Plant bHLH transcription factor ACT-like domain-containing protein n=1 Tax=Acacia crassicarpa TaxID=499986 RepID=A0AAE1JN87_9FABA|nr:hypothetical protein QN277_017098 [Acacia crassicarpa]
MVSKEQSHKRAVLHEKLQLLRSTTNSHALNRTAILMDASKYLAELKQKVERLNQDIATAQTSSDQNPLPTVTVETLEKGFLVDVFAAKTCPGLLVSILEAFEGMGLSVLEARVSCADTFRFQAVGGEEEEGVNMDAGAVKEVVGQAIKKWRETSRDEQ